MLTILKKMNLLLDKKQKRTMVLLVIMMIVGAALQVAGVGMIVPVVSMVMDADAIKGDGIAHTLYEFIGVESVSAFTSIIMIALVVIFIIKNNYRKDIGQRALNAGRN